MIKLICYGSKTLYLKEAYRSYAGEKKFTSVQIIAADEIDGHKLSNLKTSLHILLGTEENSSILNFDNDNTSECLLSSKYTANIGTIGFYLKFTQGESEDDVIGLTNTIYIDVYDNRINESVTTGNSSGNSGGNGINGKNGVTYTPKVSEDGVLSWTNDGGLPNPSPVKIVGENGVDGVTPHIGANGNWFIGDEDTGKPSRGENADDIDLSDYVPITRTIAGIDLADDITIDEMYEKLKIKPHTVDYPAPTPNTVGLKGQFYFSTETKKVYACIDQRYNPETDVIDYTWGDVTNPEILTAIDANSTDIQVASAKAVYDLFNTYDTSILSILGGDE